MMTLHIGNTCIWGWGRVPHLPNRGFSPGRMQDDLVTVRELFPGTALWTGSPVAPTPWGRGVEMLVVAHGEILLSRKPPHPTSPDWASGKADHPLCKMCQ